jgi:hypothetical protein
VELYKHELSQKPNAVNMRNWLREKREAALARLGGKCVRCGFSDPRALQFDHVRGDGTLDQKNAPNGRTGRTRRVQLGTTYKRIADGKDDGRYQILCANCNWIKRAEKEEHLTRIA